MHTSVRAMRRHDTEIVFSGSTRSWGQALLTASLGTLQLTLRRVNVQIVRDAWSDMTVSPFVEERVRVTCDDDDDEILRSILSSYSV